MALLHLLYDNFQHSLCLLWMCTLPVSYPVVAWNFQPQPEREQETGQIFTSRQ